MVNHNNKFWKHDLHIGDSCWWYWSACFSCSV